VGKFSKVVILDRDGVINYDSPQYIKSPEEFIPIPGSLEAIARLNVMGFRVGVATNQSALARGLLDLSTLEKIHFKMNSKVIDAGGKIDYIEYCPHLPSDGCYCRKPNPGMLINLGEKFCVNLTDMYFVGDKMSDVNAALAVKSSPVYIQPNLKDSDSIIAPNTLLFRNLLGFVNYLESIHSSTDVN